MNTAPRNLAFTVGIVLTVLTAGGCRDVDVPKVGEDVLALDSTLNLDMSLGTHDTASPAKLDGILTEPAFVGAKAEPAPAAESQRPSISKPQSRSRSLAVQRTQPTRRAHAATRTRAQMRSASRSVAARSSPSDRRTSVAKVGRPATEDSRTAPPARVPMRSSAILPVGFELELEAGQRICTNTSRIGDGFSARIADDVVGPLGTVIPKGTSATGEILSLTKNNGENGKSPIGIRIESITIDGRTYPVSSQVTYARLNKSRTRSRGGNAGKVAAGAGIGAVLGQVLGRNAKSTVIGAAGGAVAGAVVAARTRDFEACVPEGGRIRAELTEPLKIQLSE